MSGDAKKKTVKMRCSPISRNARGQFIGRASGIPPGYTKICLNEDVTSRIEWTGVDSKGRKQYRYSNAWNKQRKKRKYARLSLIGHTLKRLRKWIRMQLSSENGSDPIAVMLATADHCKMRAGEPRYTQSSGNRGVTTLVRSDFHDNPPTLSWSAKSGIKRTCVITNSALSNNISALFDSRVHANTLNNWLSKNYGDITLKDFRTWHANAIFVDSIRKGNDSGSSVRIAANKLGHKISTCRKYYLDPFVVAHAETHVMNLPPGQSLHVQYFSRSEQCLYLLLQKKPMVIS